MKRLLTYIRQLFVEDMSPILLGTGLLVTVSCWTIGIFVWGIDILLLPIMLGILLLSVSGPLIFICYLIRKNRKKDFKTNIFARLKSFVFGIYLGFLFLNPIADWDEQQRQKSGMIISEALENFKNEKGKYPGDLSELKSELTSLPFTYTLDKFTYNLKDEHAYDLDIPVPIMDRWHWDIEKKAFQYSDQ